MYVNRNFAYIVVAVVFPIKWGLMHVGQVSVVRY